MSNFFQVRGQAIFRMGSTLQVELNLTSPGLLAVVNTTDNQPLYAGALGSLEYHSYNADDYRNFLLEYNYAWLLFPVR